MIKDVQRTRLEKFKTLINKKLEVCIKTNDIEKQKELIAKLEQTEHELQSLEKRFIP